MSAADMHNFASEGATDEGIPHRPSPIARARRALPLRRLVPITHLKGSDLLRVWVDCSRSHFQMVMKGDLPSELSLQNFMYDEHTGRGVLHDLDFARTSTAGGPPARARSATLAFRPLALLVPEYDKGRMYRRYHHDVQTFVWILLYVLLRRSPDVRYQEIAQRLNSRDYRRCVQAKREFTLIARLRVNFYDNPWKEDAEEQRAWEVACELLYWMDLRSNARKPGAPLSQLGIFKPWTIDPIITFAQFEHIIAGAWASDSFVPMYRLSTEAAGISGLQGEMDLYRALHLFFPFDFEMEPILQARWPSPGVCRL